MAAMDSHISLLYVEDRVQKRQKARSPCWPGVKLTMDVPHGSSAVTDVRAPIVGYEVIEQRDKFTVYKIQVSSNGKSWFVFRRYTDFDRLNAKLQEAFPNFRIKLPGRRWFKDNFDVNFLKARARGLQFFVNNIMHHTDIWQSPEVKQFFCLDDPPGPYDSLEESRAYCQHLEEQLNDVKQTVQELSGELSATKSQLVQARVQQEALVSALRAERGTRECKNSKNLEGTRDVKELLAASEISWRRHAHSLTGKTARQLTSPHEEKESWRGSLEFVMQSSGLDRRAPSRENRRCASDVGIPRTSTPAKNEEEGNEPARRSHEDQFNDTVVCVDEGSARGVNESDDAQPSSNRDSGILSDNNGSPMSNM